MNMQKAFDLEAMAENAAQAEAVLKALANRQRLMILCHLTQGKMTVSELNERVALSQSALSQHLARLRQDGLVMTERKAQCIYYSLVPGLPARVIELLHDHYCATGK
ncbi:MAG: ArsR family transcriptional regulator [Gammaproteobacteria bacterium]|nr:MAG: ArsR family transcriptional regulator [Gammaproteobacteria bacterium]